MDFSSRFSEHFNLGQILLGQPIVPQSALRGDISLLQVMDNQSTIPLQGIAVAAGPGI